MTIEYELAMHRARWNFLSGEISGTYFYETRRTDYLLESLYAAVNENNLEEMNHYTAVMLVVMQGRNQFCAGHSKTWGELDREYHAKFCVHPICVERRKEQHV